MKVIVIILVIIALLYFSIRKFHSREAKSKQNANTFVCPNCGEHHCDCHRPDESHN